MLVMSLNGLMDIRWVDGTDKA